MLEVIVVEEFIEKIRDSRAVIRCQTAEETRRIINCLISVGCVCRTRDLDEDEMPIFVGVNPFSTVNAVDVWEGDDDALCDWFEEFDFEVPQIFNFDDCLDFINEHENMIGDILADLPAELI